MATTKETHAAIIALRQSGLRSAEIAFRTRVPEKIVKSFKETQFH